MSVLRVLAIDQGTTSTRAFLVEDGRGRVVHTVEHHQNFPQTGWVEHDPEELLANVSACLTAAGPVDAVGIDNQGESCLAWEAGTARPLTPVIVWQDNRTHASVSRLKAEGAETVTLARAGLPLDPYFSASKLRWILDNVPEAVSLAARGRLRLGTTDSFFLERLTGVATTDVTTASRTSLMNLETLAWDEELCRLFGVPIAALPDIRPTMGERGGITLSGHNVPVTASVVDQQASLYGHGCRRAGDMKITFGTGAFALAVTGGEICRAPDKGLLPTVAWQRSGEAPVYALDGGVYCASSAVNWARSLGLFDAFSEIGTFAREPAIARGLAFVPALAGLAAPYWDRSAAGLWVGLSLDADRRDLVQAVIEGVALRAAQVVEAMSELVPLDGPVSIDGGMASNPYLCQFLADALACPVVVPEMGELTALGTALMAAGNGEEAGPMPGRSRTYAPARVSHDWTVRFADAVARCRGWNK